MEEQNSVFRNLWLKLAGHHLRNKKSGLYGYMWWTGLKFLIIYVLVMVPLVLIGKYLIDLNAMFQYIVNNLSDKLMLIVFLISESIIGLIPPDFFVIWTTKFHSPFFLLTILGVISYIGGIFAYLIGYWLSTRPKIKSYSDRVMNKYGILIRKWGGAFIIISALFPFLHFPLVILVVSLFGYPFKRYLLFGISRIARFLIQGVFFLHILNMDSFFTF
jgi:membrane protein YqaA with SNARE-associated domain